jgi:glycosyltransferase involved in cell wall biosynthesis
VRVLHLAAGNLFGGVETYLLTLARLRHLCPRMEPQFGVCFPGRLRDELAAAGVPVHDLGAVRVSRPWTVLRARRRLRRVIREQRIDVVVTHASWPHAVFAHAVRRGGARLVNMLHDAPAGRHWAERWAARTPPDRVIANSRFTAASAGLVYPGVEVEVCYLPVAASAVGDRDAVRHSVRAELQTPHDAVVVLQASRLERWKGQSVLVEALAQLRDLPGWVAWIAGGPQKSGEDEFLRELVAAADRGGVAENVRFLGQRKDVARLMAAADVYCQPNTGPEPFGIALVEALHAGLPVISSDFGGAKEIITETCGVLCTPGDVPGVAAALRELMSDPASRRSLGAAGPPRADEVCGPERQVNALANALTNSAAVWA